MFVKRIVDYIKYNGEKWMTIQVYLYAAFYRWCILMIPKQRLELMMGNRGQESSWVITNEQKDIVKLVSFHVGRVSKHTPWESKCLVRAMTAKKVLMNKRIPCTLYLGVGKEEGKMIAHAWLRSGDMYVTGGTGKNFAIVTKFSS